MSQETVQYAINMNTESVSDVDDCAKQALSFSKQNCLSFPWIKERVDQEKLAIHLWFFDIKHGEILSYSLENEKFLPL